MDSVASQSPYTWPRPMEARPRRISPEKTTVPEVETKRREIAWGSVPEFIRPALMERGDEVRDLMERTKVSGKREILDLDGGEYRYVALAFDAKVPVHLQRQLTGLLTSLVGGWTLPQGEKFTTLTKNSADVIPALMLFSEQANKILAENQLSKETQVFWLSVGEPQENATIRIASLPGKTRSEMPRLLVHQALQVTPEGVLFPSATAGAAVSHSESFSALGKAVEAGEAYPILSQDEHDPVTSTAVDYTVEKKNASFKNIHAIKKTPEGIPASGKVVDQAAWKNFAAKNWDVLSNMAIGEAPFTLGEMEQLIKRSPETLKNLIMRTSGRREEPPRAATQEIVPAEREMLFNIDISGMNAINLALSKERESGGRSQSELRDIQAGTDSIFTEWLQQAVGEAHKAGMKPFELAGDGFGALSQASPVESMGYLNTLSTSWDLLLQDKRGSGTPQERLAAGWLQERFGNRVFIKIALAETRAKMSLIPAGENASTVLMESQAEEFAQAVHGQTKELNPKVETIDEKTEAAVNDFFVKNRIRLIGGLNKGFLDRLATDIADMDAVDQSIYEKVFRSLKVVAFPTESETLYFLAEIPQNADRFVEAELGQKQARLLELFRNAQNRLEFSDQPFLKRQEQLAQIDETLVKLKEAGAFQTRGEGVAESVSLLEDQVVTGANLADQESHAKLEAIGKDHSPTLIYNMYVQNDRHTAFLIQDLLSLRDGQGKALLHFEDISIMTKESLVNRKGQWELSEFETDLSPKAELSGTKEVGVTIRFPVVPERSERDLALQVDQVARTIFSRGSIMSSEALPNSWVVPDVRANGAAQVLLEKYRREGEPTYFQSLEVYEKTAGTRVVSTLLHPEAQNYEDTKKSLMERGYAQGTSFAVLNELANFIKGE